MRGLCSGGLSWSALANSSLFLDHADKSDVLGSDFLGSDCLRHLRLGISADDERNYDYGASGEWCCST